MSGTNTDRIADSLRRWRNLEECLLHEIRVSPDLYRIELKFNHIWKGEDRVRERVLEEPVFVTLRLVGIEELQFIGALTEGMKGSPELLDWGLTEVAGVRVRDRNGLIALTVDWESERRLEVRCVTIELVEPDT